MNSSWTETIVQAFLDFRNFWFNAVYNSILFSFPLVPLNNLDFCSFCFRGLFLCPHINSVNRGMPVPRWTYSNHTISPLDHINPVLPSPVPIAGPRFLLFGLLLRVFQRTVLIIFFWQIKLFTALSEISHGKFKQRMFSIICYVCSGGWDFREAIFYGILVLMSPPVVRIPSIT